VGGAAPPRQTVTEEISFTKNFYTKAKANTVTEKDAKDVYYHGKVRKPQILVRTYTGYEIGIYYFLTPDTGKPVITSIWKRTRR
jgi:hypothetical protein